INAIYRSLLAELCIADLSPSSKARLLLFIYTLAFVRTRDVYLYLSYFNSPSYSALEYSL
ncbi:hypothetical protein CC78DRAFT_536344, partial [Lojkania enalia]